MNQGTTSGFTNCYNVHGSLTYPWTAAASSQGGPQSRSRSMDHLTDRTSTCGNQKGTTCPRR